MDNKIWTRVVLFGQLALTHSFSTIRISRGGPLFFDSRCVHLPSLVSNSLGSLYPGGFPGSLLNKVPFSLTNPRLRRRFQGRFLFFFPLLLTFDWRAAGTRNAINIKQLETSRVSNLKKSYLSYHLPAA